MTFVFFAALAFAACVFYALLPLFTAATQPDAPNATPALSEAQQNAARQALVEELRELELDHELGKIDTTAYKNWRSTKETQLAALLGNKG